MRMWNRQSSPSVETTLGPKGSRSSTPCYIRIDGDRVRYLNILIFSGGLMKSFLREQTLIADDALAI